MATIKSGLEKAIEDAFNVIKALKPKILKREDQFIVDLPELQYRKEFATIKISFPRRMGNTTLALKCFKQFKDSILIVYNRSSMIDLLNGNKYLNSKIDRVFAPNMKFPDGTSTFKGLSSKIVIVDTASVMEKKAMDAIYNIKAGLYILIG
jgi:hypothetical protein